MDKKIISRMREIERVLDILDMDADWYQRVPTLHIEYVSANLTQSEIDLLLQIMRR